MRCMRFVAAAGLVLATALSVSAAPLVTGGLTFYYSFDDVDYGDDVIVNDGSGNDMDGKVLTSASAGQTSTITFVPGVYGNCAQFDVSKANDSAKDDWAMIEIVDSWQSNGRPDPVTAGDPTSYAYLNNGDEPNPADIPTSAMTFALWVNTAVNPSSDQATFCAAAFDADASISGGTATNTAWPYHLQIQKGDSFRYTIRKDGGVGAGMETLVNDSSILSGEASQINDTWSHLAWTFSAADNFWGFYLDGQLKASGTPVSGSIYDNWDVGAALGCNTDIARQFLGGMDEVYMFKRCLSASEIATLAVFPGLQGDLNNDGYVNSGDLDLVRANWGTAGPTGDANLDGAVNSGDLDIIRANWGAHSAASAVVPEPTTFVLLGAMGLLACLIRRK